MIKAFLKNILFKGKQPKTFPALRIPDGKINETVFLKSGENEFEITKNHCVVCHRPFLIAVWSNFNSVSDNTKWELIVRENVEVRARAKLKLDQKIEVEKQSIAIFYVERAQNLQTGYLRQLLLHRYFKNKDTLLESKIYAALYSYPRQVIIVSYKENDYLNIFPMDFQCVLPEKQLVVLGLRTTNATIEKIIKTGKLVISDSGSLSLETIYQLGRNHSQAPPSVEKLPFKIIDSERHNFPVPESCAYYQEIEIINNKKLGSHMLLLGKVVNKKRLKDKPPSVYHIQFLQSFASDYQPA